jgi:hypothetical protein
MSTLPKAPESGRDHIVTRADVTALLAVEFLNTSTNVLPVE